MTLERANLILPLAREALHVSINLEEGTLTALLAVIFAKYKSADAPVATWRALTRRLGRPRPRPFSCFRHCC